MHLYNNLNIIFSNYMPIPYILFSPYRIPFKILSLQLIFNFF
nr:MAG TPA: hypothetical protein [Caudoviricetes sp.]